MLAGARGVSEPGIFGANMELVAANNSYRDKARSTLMVKKALAASPLTSTLVVLCDRFIE